MQRLGRVLPQDGAHNPHPQQVQPCPAHTALPSAWFPINGFFFSSQAGRENPGRLKILGCFFQDVVAQSHMQHLKKGLRMMCVLKKNPSNSPKALKSSRINSGCPKTTTRQKPPQSGVPGPLWSQCGQREVSCNAPRCWFASKSALCYKEDGDGDLPAGNELLHVILG